MEMEGAEMDGLSFSAMPTAIALRARQALADGYGHKLKVQVSESLGNPCRHCLRMAVPQQRIILLSYSPFGDHNPYSEVGPIFICADECPQYAERHVFPPDFRSRALVLRAYNVRHEIEDAALAQPGQAEMAAMHLFQNPACTYIHARHPTFGCYDFKIERGPAAAKLA